MSFVEEFTYDRGKLTTGVNSTQTYAPVYGSSIKFSSKNTAWNAGNYNSFIMPQGINNLMVEMNLKFQGDRNRIDPLLLRLERLTTGEVIGNEALREIEYAPSFDGSLNEVYVLTGVNADQEISQINRLTNGVYVPENGSLQAYWSGVTGNGGYRDIVFPFVINADGETKYDISFDYSFGGSIIDRYYFLINGQNIKVQSQNVYISNSLGSYSYEGAYTTNSTTKTGYLALRAYDSIDPTPTLLNTNPDQTITFSNVSMKETYYDTVLNFGDTVNSVKVNLDTDYYNNFSGSQIQDFSVQDLGYNVYEVNVNAFNNSNSSLLQKGMAFVNKTNVTAWDSYTEGQFGVVSGAANSNIFDNYFYITGAEYDEGDQNFLNNISGLIGYTGYYNEATRVFFWEPDQQVTVQLGHQNRINNFKNSFMDQLNVGRNQNRINQIDLTFSNRGQKETYSMLHFLESHLGYLPFVYYYGDSIINGNRVFYCPEWTHTFNYKDSNTISAKFIEIANPTIPKF